MQMKQSQVFCHRFFCVPGADIQQHEPISKLQMGSTLEQATFAESAKQSATQTSTSRLLPPRPIFLLALTLHMRVPKTPANQDIPHQNPDHNRNSPNPVAKTKYQHWDHSMDGSTLGAFIFWRSPPPNLTVRVELYGPLRKFWRFENKYWRFVKTSSFEFWRLARANFDGSGRSRTIMTVAYRSFGSSQMTPSKLHLHRNGATQASKRTSKWLRGSGFRQLGGLAWCGKNAD